MIKSHFFISLYLVFTVFFINRTHTMNRNKALINKINHYPPKVRYKIKLRRLKELQNQLNQKKWQLFVKAYECGIIQIPSKDQEII